MNPKEFWLPANYQKISVQVDEWRGESYEGQDCKTHDAAKAIDRLGYPEETEELT
jgi:hypothetical protein